MSDTGIDRARDQVIDPVTARVAQDSAWVDIQRRTFTRWCNTFLTERLFEIKDITTDLSDGIIFINLLEEISNKEVCKRYNRKPVMRAQKLENISFCFNFLKQEQIKLVGMGPEDVCDGKLKLILGLIWTLILRFQINRGDQKGSAKNALLEWVRSQIPEYNIQNFTSDWQSGKAICALADAVAPGVIDLSRISDNSLANATYGIETAKDQMEIPSILDPTDMVNSPDEHSNMAYISFFRDYLERAKNQKAEDEILRTPIPAKCKAYGPGLEKAEAKIPTEFTIESINARNSRCPCGGHPWSVRIKDQNGADLNVSIEDHNNGLYTAKYTPLSAGRLSIAVTLFDKHIPQSAFSVLVTPAVVDENLSDAFGPGLEGAQVGKEAPFTVVLKNRLGDPIGESHPIDVKVTGPHGEALPVNKTDNGDGTFALSYLPIDEGNHHIEVSLNGKPIAKSPYNITADFPEGEAYASKCFAEGPGLQSGVNDTSDPTHFTIHTVDKHGNPINTEMDPYDVMIFSPAGDLIDPLSIDHKDDGTYVVTYHPTEPGDYEIDVVVRNPHSPLHYDHIAQSPFHVSVKPGTDASNSWAEGDGLRDGILDTLPTSFTIHAANREGEQMNRGGDPFEVKIVDPKGETVPADIKDNGDGTYKVDYKPSGGPGPYKINVDLKGKPIKDAPFNINIKAGAWPAFCLVDRYTFVVQSKTAAGENKIEGGEDIIVQINGPNGPVDTVDLKDLGDGTYLVSYKLPHGDNQQEFNVSVTINGEHIKGSPWKQFY